MINVASASTLANGDIELSVCPSFDATGGTFSLGYRGDTASGYDSHQVRLTFQFAF